MKYYSEDHTKKTRLAFEGRVLHWPQVHSKKMFGCPAYQAKGKLFAFLVTNGVVITQLDQADREKLSSKSKVDFFQAGKRVVRNWVKVPVRDKRDLDRVMPFVRRSYQSALRKS